MSVTSVTHRGLRAWAAAAALGLAALLGGCSEESAESTGVGAPSFNDADVKSAQTMIPHHEQAVEMADSILGKSGMSPEVTQLAQQIRDTQRPQMETLTGFLTAWNKPLIPDHGSEADEDHWEAEGMLTPEEIQALAAADGSTAEKLFLEGMIQHHEGAITMVQSEIDDGENPDAVQLAQTIKTGQTVEIEAMKRMHADR